VSSGPPEDASEVAPQAPRRPVPHAPIGLAKLSPSRLSDGALFALVTAVVFVTRLPFLGNGYGIDADAWRLVRAGQQLAQTGDYHTSRLPGYPIPEVSLAVLYHGGPWLTNGVSALLSGVAVAFFALVMRHLGNPYATLAAVGLALAPVVYVASVQTMDYMWALAFAMASVYTLTRDRPLLAGILLGLAAGCRVTSLVLLLPFLAYVLWPPRPPGLSRFLVKLIAASLGTFLAAYAVVLVTLRGNVLPDLAPVHRTALATAIRGTFDVWGVLGLLAIGGALVATIAVAIVRGRRAAYDARGYGKVIAMCTVALVTYAAVYLRAPLDASYLIPALPFALLLLARIPRPAFTVVCAALIVSPFVFTLTDVAAGPRTQRSVIVRGRIFIDRNRRLGAMRTIHQIESACSDMHQPSVLVAGWYKPWLDVLDGGRVGQCTVVLSVTPEELAGYQTDGVGVWVVPKVKDYVEHMTGVDLDPPAAQPLDVTPAPADDAGQ